MAGYTDSFISVDGQLISASLFQQEYTNLGSAFDQAGGHKHDGTAGEGAYISVLADSADLNEVFCDSGSDQIVLSINVGAVKTAQLTIADGAILPAVTNDIDLGSLALELKDIHSAGTANLTNLALGVGITASAILDDGTMAANSATSLVSQASIVTYVAAVTLDGGAF